MSKWVGRSEVIRMGKNIIHMYVENELVRVADVEELKKEAPGWTGEVGLGDVVVANGVERRVMELKQRFPDTEDDDYIVELYLKYI